MKSKIILSVALLYLGFLVFGNFFHNNWLESATRITVTKDTSGNVDDVTKIRTSGGAADCIDLTGGVRTGTFDSVTGDVVTANTLNSSHGTVQVDVVGATSILGTTATIVTANVSNLNATGVNVTDQNGVLEIGNVYQVDVSESDQCTAGSGDSFYDLAVAVGTSEKATIIFRHTSGGNTTDYTCSTTWGASAYTNITLEFETGARIVDDANNASFTWGGSINAENSQQIFDWGNGTGHIIYPTENSNITEVSPEQWGCVSAASIGTVTDCTDAIDHALYTGKNVKLGNGYYGTTGGHSILKDGQKLQGAGIRSVDDNGGTYLYKISGTNVVVTSGSFAAHEISDMTIDGHDLDGNILRVQAYRANVHDLRLINQGGSGATGYGLYCWYANENTYSNIDITGVGGILIYRATSAGYSEFSNIFVELDDPSYFTLNMTGYNVGYLFNNFYVGTGLIKLDATGGSIEGVHFKNLNVECANTSSLFQIVSSGTLTRNVTVDGARILSTASGSIFDFQPVYGFELNSIYIRDTSGTLNKDIIKLNGAYSGKISNLGVYPNANSDIIECATAVSDLIDVNNVYISGGSAGAMHWWTTKLNVSNSNCTQSFIGASSSAIFKNVSGTVTYTNCTYYQNLRSDGNFRASDDIIAGKNIQVGANGGDNYILMGTNHIKFGAAAPVAGAWSQGDIVFNTGAASGQPSYWQCTVAGTPGTWTAGYSFP